MCWMIFIGVSGYRGDPSVLFREHGLLAQPTRNPACNVIDFAAKKFEISDGHCACSLYSQPGRHELLDETRWRAQYERKGWSKRKVTSAVEGRIAAEARRLKKLADANPLPATIRKLVENSSRIDLLAHLFDGSFDKPFEITGRETPSLETFLARGGSFQADTLITMFGYVR